MHKSIKLLAVTGLFFIFSSAANAGNVSDQIKDAVRKGDFNLVQTLVGKNPGTTGKAEDTLLKHVHGKIENDPVHASKAMSTASFLAPGIIPPDAPNVADNVQKIVKLIADKALYVCNPEANDNASQLQTPEQKRKIETAKAVAKILDDAGTIAQLPVIVAIRPQLFAEIQAQSAQCATDDALLAQKPGYRPQRFPPHLIPDPVPPTPASPD